MSATTSIAAQAKKVAYPHLPLGKTAIASNDPTRAQANTRVAHGDKVGRPSMSGTVGRARVAVHRRRVTASSLSSAAHRRHRIASARLLSSRIHLITNHSFARTSIHLFVISDRIS